VERPRFLAFCLFGLAGWTLFVWGTRINNALGDAELSGGGKAFSIGLSVTLIALAVAAVVARLRRHPVAERIATIFAWVSIGVWVIRLPMILIADHSVGFKVVHGLLGLVAISLAAIVLWGLRPRVNVPLPDEQVSATAMESSDHAGRR